MKGETRRKKIGREKIAGVDGLSMYRVAGGQRKKQ